MRAPLPVTTAVFALTSVVHGGLFAAKPKVEVTADAQIHLYPFASSDCTGEPYTSPYEMRQGECVNFHQAHSMKPRYRSDHGDWIKEVNDLKVYCKLETFSAYHCQQGNRTVKYRKGFSGDVPKNLNKCLVARRQRFQEEQDSYDSSDGESPYPMYSARFVCGRLENPEHLCTSTLEQTFWSVEPTYGSPTYSVQKVTLTGSLSATAHAQVAARSAAVEGFKPGRESKGVWLLHPWSQSWLCFTCYPKKEHDYRKIECRGGDPFPANCGVMPTEDGHATHHSTSTSEVTAVTTIHRTDKATAYSESTRIVTGALFQDALSSDEEFGDLDIELSQKKSWHTPVKFQHPFIDGKDACADAEWEKRGQGPKSYVKIQHVHFCDNKDRADSQWIGLPSTVIHTVTATKTSSHTISHTSTSTATLLKTTTTIRHDQL